MPVCGCRTVLRLETVDFSQHGAIPAGNTGSLRLSPSAPYNLVHSQAPLWSAVWPAQSKAELANRFEVALGGQFQQLAVAVSEQAFERDFITDQTSGRSGEHHGRQCS
jgi:hypothetical protein